MEGISMRSDNHVISSGPTTLAGYPAYGVVYTNSERNDQTMRIWTLVGDKVYSITYIEDIGQAYYSNLQLVQQVINTLEINPNTPSLTSYSQYYPFDKIFAT